MWTDIGSALVSSAWGPSSGEDTPEAAADTYGRSTRDRERAEKAPGQDPSHMVTKPGLETSSPPLHDGLRNSAWEPRGVTSKSLSPETQILDLSSRISCRQPGLGIRLRGRLGGGAGGAVVGGRVEGRRREASRQESV